MDRTKIIAWLTMFLAALTAGCAHNQHQLSVGSKNFTEQVILGEIVAQHLENRLHTEVTRHLNMGGTLLVHQAIVNGEIDVYPEYTGTALMAILKVRMTADAQSIRERVQEMYHDSLRLDWLPSLGFENTFAMVVRKDTADKWKLTTLSDAEACKEDWRIGVGYEFQERPDGAAAFNTTYHLQSQGGATTMDLGLLYKALEQKQVNMIAANSTDGMLAVAPVKILRDDRHAFPPYEAALVTRLESEKLYPQLKPALEELSGKISDKTMRELNYQVDGKKTPAGLVAAGFLRQVGLAK
jgi:osmoprotectant transport system substrate-binding protein